MDWSLILLLVLSFALDYFLKEKKKKRVPRQPETADPDEPDESPLQEIFSEPEEFPETVDGTEESVRPVMDEPSFRMEPAGEEVKEMSSVADNVPVPEPDPGVMLEGSVYESEISDAGKEVQKKRKKIDGREMVIHAEILRPRF